MRYLFTPDDYLLLFNFTGFKDSLNDCETVQQDGSFYLLQKFGNALSLFGRASLRIGLPCWCRLADLFHHHAPGELLAVQRQAQHVLASWQAAHVEGDLAASVAWC
jgi:hypothetical protein